MGLPFKILCSECGIDYDIGLSMFHKIIEHLKYGDSERLLVPGFGVFYTRKTKLVSLTPKQHKALRVKTILIGGNTILCFKPSPTATKWLGVPSTDRYFGEPNPALTRGSNRGKGNMASDLILLAKYQDRVRELVSLGRPAKDIINELKQMERVSARIRTLSLLNKE